MYSDELSIHVKGLGKRFEMYAQPSDRLKQMILPKVRRFARRGQREYFKEFWALRDVDFKVTRGETVGIVGRNGSGKSTLLQMICGTLTPTLGNVAVNGRIAALLELGAGFNPEFSGRENVFLSGLLYGISEQELRKKFDTICDFADIGDFIDQPVKTYSSGMMVRLAFSVAINVEPEILVIDEALSVGDEAFQRKCFARIDTIREAGATVLFVSHAAGTVIELCNRAILLDGGELLALGTPKFVVSRYHKLLYAPESRVAAIREEIRREAGMTQEEAKTSSDAVSKAPADGRHTNIEEAYFDEGLMPKSTVRYEPLGARIGQVRVQTLEGSQVNVLRSGGEYIFAYEVDFEKAAYGVRFGMLIKTVTGLPLGGSASGSNAGNGATISAEQSFSAQFRFRALLAPGVYFLNAGVTAADADGEIYLDRVIDVAMIRVMPDNDRLATGVIDFEIEPMITRVPETSEALS